MKKAPLAALAAAALLFGAAALGRIPSGIRRTYSPAPTPPREPYRLVSGGADRLDVNRVTGPVLAGLPGVGRYASGILALRRELGGFTSLEQLSLVPGIGRATCLKAAEVLKITEK